MKLKYFVSFKQIVMLLFFVSTTSNAYLKTVDIQNNSSFQGTRVIKENVLANITGTAVNISKDSGINNFSVQSFTVGDGNADIDMVMYCAYPEYSKRYRWS